MFISRPAWIVGPEPLLCKVEEGELWEKVRTSLIFSKKCLAKRSVCFNTVKIMQATFFRLPHPQDAAAKLSIKFIDKHNTDCFNSKS